MDENGQSLLEWLRKNCPQLLSKALLDQQFLSLLINNNGNDTKNASTDGVIHRNHSNGTRNRTKAMANASSTAKITQSSTPPSLEMSESLFSSTIIPDPQKHQQQNRITTMWTHQSKKFDSNFMATNYNNGLDEDGNDQNKIIFDGHQPISLSEFRLNGFQTDDPNNLIKVTTSDNEMTSGGSGSMIMVNNESPLSQAHIIQSHSDSSRNAFIYVMVILTIYLMAVACIAIQYYRKHQTLDPFSAYMLGKNTKRAKEHRARHYRRKQQVPSKNKPQPQASNTSPLPSPSQTSSSSSNHNHLQHHLHHHAHLHCHDIGSCPRKTTSSLLHHLNSSPNLSANPSPPLLTCSFSASTFDPREDDSTPTSHIPDQLDHQHHKPTCSIMNLGPDFEPMDDDYNDERLQQSRCVSNPAKHHHPHSLVYNQNPNNTTMIKCHHLKSKVSSNSATSAQLNAIFMDSCSPDSGGGHGSSNLNDGCHGFSNRINNNTNNNNNDNKNKMGDLHTSNDVCHNGTTANILLDNNNHNDNNNEYNESLDQIQIDIEQCGSTNNNLNQNGTKVKPETIETKSNLPIYTNQRIIDNQSFYEEEDDDFEPETENDDDNEEEEEDESEEEEEEEEEDHEVDDEYDTPDIILTTSSTTNQQESRPKMAQIPRAIRLKNFFSFGSYSGATTINTNTASTKSYTPPPTVPLTYNASHTLDQATVPLPEVASKSKPPPLKFLMRSLSLRTSFDSSSSTSTTNITNTDIFSSSNIDHHHALHHHHVGDRQSATASAKMVRFQTRRSSSSVIHSPYGSQIICQAASGSVSSGSGGLGSARYEETHL